MELFSVWKNSASVGEQCLMRSDGSYVGVKTGTVYSKEAHASSKRFLAKITGADEKNNTGMLHLCSDVEFGGEENRRSGKLKFAECFVTLEPAHLFGGVCVYRCLELSEYFSENEVEIIRELQTEKI